MDILAQDRTAEKTQFAQLLQHLWRGGRVGYLWFVSQDGKKHTQWWDTRVVGDYEFNRYIYKRLDQNIYFGIHPTNKAGTRSTRSLKAPDPKKPNNPPVVAANCLFADFDTKDLGSKDAIMDHLADLPTPNVIIDSGGGCHCYWLLRDTMPITDENREHVIDIQERWVDFIGSDRAVKDLARVLRVPGTRNMKPDYAPDHPVVTITRFDLENLYTWEDLVELLPPAPVAITPAQTYTNGTGPALNLTDEDLVERASRAQNGPKFQRLWDGVITGYPSQSEADEALLCILAFWTQKDPGSMDRLFRASGLYREDKWEREDYRTRSINGAISKTSETYQPRVITTTTTTSTRNGTGPTRAQTAATTDGTYDGPYEGPPVDLGPIVDPETGEIVATGAPKQKWDYRAEDGGILDLWIKQHSHEWMWITGYDCWYRWNGTHWAKDETLQMHHQTQKLIDRLNWDAQQAKKRAKLEQDKEGELVANGYISATKRTAARMRSVMEIAQPHRAVAAATLDAGNVINLANGTLDLDTLKLRAHNPTDHLTYTLPYSYDPKADAPRFKRFVGEVLVKEESTTPDTDLVHLFQELWGYTLTVDTSQHVMMWLSGEGGNGKSVALNVLQALLGPMACNVNFQTLGTPGDYTLADLPGKRLVLSTESERGGTAAEKQIREIASGDRQRARAIYGTPFEFKPVAKIWWAMNDRPVIKDTSNATWRRLKLIPFHRTFSKEEQDTQLEQTLLSELPGILNWALVGLKRLRTVGSFTEAAAVTDAVAEYRKETNPVAQWLEDRTVALPTPSTLSSELYTDYDLWCHKNGRHSLNATNFGTELKRLKFEKKRTNSGYVYPIGLKT